MAEAQLPALEGVTLADLDRPPDPSIYSIGCPELVAPLAVRNAVVQWVNDVGLSMDMALVVGDAPARRFTLQLLGGRELTTPSSSALARHLKLPGGAWGTFGAAAATGQHIPLYVSADRSPKGVRKELQTRRLQRQLAEWYSVKTFVGRKPRGRIMLNGAPWSSSRFATQRTPPTKLISSARLAITEELGEKYITAEFDSLFAEDRGASCG